MKPFQRCKRPLRCDLNRFVSMNSEAEVYAREGHAEEGRAA